MNIEIITIALDLNVYGFSGVALNGDYAGTAFKLMDRMGQIVRSNELVNKGKNTWIYEQGDRVFAGVELDQPPGPGITLEHKSCRLLKYARFTHIGPYQLIGQAGQAMREELKQTGCIPVLPYVEIYGHWSNDETKLKTELLQCLK